MKMNWPVVFGYIAAIDAGLLALGHGLQQSGVCTGTCQDVASGIIYTVGAVGTVLGLVQQAKANANARALATTAKPS